MTCFYFLDHWISINKYLVWHIPAYMPAHNLDLIVYLMFVLNCLLKPIGRWLHWLAYLIRNKVAACAKHFVGDGGTHKGINEGNTLTSYEDLEKIHMAPYLDCISQGVCTVMASYSSWNGDKMHSHKFLLTQVLKDKLGFKVTNFIKWE